MMALRNRILQNYYPLKTFVQLKIGDENQVHMLLDQHANFTYNTSYSKEYETYIQRKIKKQLKEEQINIRLHILLYTGSANR